MNVKKLQFVLDMYLYVFWNCVYWEHFIEVAICDINRLVLCAVFSFVDLSKAQRSFAQVLDGFRFECIGEVETDDEIHIGKLNYAS